MITEWIFQSSPAVVAKVSKNYKVNTDQIRTGTKPNEIVNHFWAIVLVLCSFRSVDERLSPK